MREYHRRSSVKVVLYLFFTATLLLTLFNMWDRNFNYTLVFAFISVIYYYVFTMYKRAYVLLDDEELIFYQGLKRKRFLLTDLTISKMSPGLVELTSKAENKKYTIYLASLGKKDAADLLNNLKKKIKSKLP